MIPADNLDIFRKVIFNLPNFRRTLLLLVSTALLYSAVIYVLLERFLETELSLILVPILMLALFAVPSVVSSELYTRFFRDYPRRWGYFLSLVNQVIIFLFVLAVALAGESLTVWNIMWLGIVTLFISNLLVLTLSVGPDFKRTSLLSLVHPLMILAGFHLAIGWQLQIGILPYLSNFLIVVVSGAVLLTFVKISDFLMGSNVSNVSTFELAAALLRNSQEDLDLGRKVRPRVETLEIDNSSGLKRIAVPWIHPGPIQGFGGAEISGKIIEKLNEGENRGFFFHAPSCHRMDPADKESYGEIIEAMESPEKGKASKIISREYGSSKMYGRNLEEGKIVFIEVDGYDDYESGIFRDIARKNNATVIDLHNQEEGFEGEEMIYGTVDAEELRSDFRDFLDELEGLELSDYSAGVDVCLSQKPVFAWTEKVGDQETLLFGVEGNDISKELKQLEKEKEEEYDEVLVFSTDTHASIHELANNIAVDMEELEACIENAEKDLSPAEIGVKESFGDEVRLLKDDYNGLVHSINILVRLLPISLVALYLGLVIWLL